MFREMFSLIRKIKELKAQKLVMELRRSSLIRTHLRKAKNWFKGTIKSKNYLEKWLEYKNIIVPNMALARTVQIRTLCLQQSSRRSCDCPDKLTYAGNRGANIEEILVTGKLSLAVVTKRRSSLVDHWRPRLMPSFAGKEMESHNDNSLNDPSPFICHQLHILYTLLGSGSQKKKKKKMIFAPPRVNRRSVSGDLLGRQRLPWTWRRSPVKIHCWNQIQPSSPLLSINRYCFRLDKVTAFKVAMFLWCQQRFSNCSKTIMDRSAQQYREIIPRQPYQYLVWNQTKNFMVKARTSVNDDPPPTTTSTES